MSPLPCFAAQCNAVCKIKRERVLKSLLKNYLKQKLFIYFTLSERRAVTINLLLSLHYKFTSAHHWIELFVALKISMPSKWIINIFLTIKNKARVSCNEMHMSTVVCLCERFDSIQKCFKHIRTLATICHDIFRMVFELLIKLARYVQASVGQSVINGRSHWLLALKNFADWRCIRNTQNAEF